MTSTRGPKSNRCGRRSATAASIALSVVVSSCSTMATVPEDDFLRNRVSMSDEAACAALFTAAKEYKATGRTSYFGATITEIERRGKSVDWCNKRRDEQADTAAGIGLIAALVGIVAVAAKSGAGGGNYAAPTRAPGSDYEWDWDQFYDQAGQLIWRCRGVQTGQFAIDAECINKLQVDARWPGLTFRAGAATR